jgi:hypothetical protein
MEQSRVIYETLLHKRCSDSHWTKTKKLMIACDLPQDHDGFSILINLRKVSPRYFTKYVEIKDELTRMGNQLLPAISLGITGNQFLELLQNLQIKPDQGTVSRWFKNVGGFRSKRYYEKSVILPVLAIALIYRHRKQSNQLNKVC